MLSSTILSVAQNQRKTSIEEEEKIWIVFLKKTEKWKRKREGWWAEKEEQEWGFERQKERD